MILNLTKFKIMFLLQKQKQSELKKSLDKRNEEGKDQRK